MLFIAAGAFHLAKPSDLIPELQGRFPIRVELAPLTADDFVRILTEPNNALTQQYAALLSATERVTIEWTPPAIAALAKIAADVNKTTHDIRARRSPHRGARAAARRLTLLFNAPDIGAADHPDHRELRHETARGARRRRRSDALHPLKGPWRMLILGCRRRSPRP